MIDDTKEALLKTLTIEKVRESICQLEDNHKLEGGGVTNLVKWKDRSNQVVVESDDYFYKVYQDKNYELGPFMTFVRNALAKEYQRLGIHWDQITFERDCSIFNFQQRQKLTVATESDGPFGELLLSFSYILDRVEQTLEFNSILSQLKQYSHFKNVQCLKLARECVNKYDDYAVFKDQTILLDDAEFYIALVGADGMPLKIMDGQSYSVPVKTSYSDFLFTNCSTGDENSPECGLKLSSSNSITHGWYLFKTKEEQSNAAIEKTSGGATLTSTHTRDLRYRIEIAEKAGKCFV